MTILGNVAHLHYIVFGSHKIAVVGLIPWNEGYIERFLFEADSEEECQMWCDLHSVKLTTIEEVHHLWDLTGTRHYE